ncbi:hypothetical protein M885DRAFT_570895 [Pelagophyceae sp. CCMP2097]|nr:hypothetical protein M885DRAFT_570895 [Pelagophyceae sp. CCMP2097]
MVVPAAFAAVAAIDARKHPATAAGSAGNAEAAAALKQPAGSAVHDELCTAAAVPPARAPCNAKQRFKALETSIYAALTPHRRALPRRRPPLPPPNASLQGPAEPSRQAPPWGGTKEPPWAPRPKPA